MSKRLSRKEIKRDRVGEVLSRAMVYLSGHVKLAALLIGGLVVVVIVGLTLNRMLGGRWDAASDALAAAIETLSAPLTSQLPPDANSQTTSYATPVDRREAALEQFEEVADEYGRSSSARIARSYVAVLVHENGDGERARDLWQQLAKGDDILSAQAELNLLTVDRQEGRAAEAETRLLALLDSNDGILPQDVILYQLALTQELLGKSEESSESFRRLAQEHPQSVHAAEASRKIGS